MKRKDLTFCFLIYKLMINGENQAVGTIRQFTWEDSFLIIGCCLVNPIQNKPDFVFNIWQGEIWQLGVLKALTWYPMQNW